MYKLESITIRGLVKSQLRGDFHFPLLPNPKHKLGACENQERCVYVCKSIKDTAAETCGEASQEPKNYGLMFICRSGGHYFLLYV